MNAQIYSTLLVLCPADLRREFGSEMTEVFLEDLDEYRRRSGLPGVARVWGRSLADLCSAALREAIARRQFVAPLISCGLLQLWWAFVCLMRSELPSSEMVLSFSVYGLVSAAIAFAVARAADGDVPISLELERR